MMHTLRNRKTGRKSARRRFAETRRRSQTAVYPYPAGGIRHSNSHSRRLWASEPECDAHICLNLGFTSQKFRLSQVSRRVCYFWLSPFRMDEENHLPSEQESRLQLLETGARNAADLDDFPVDLLDWFIARDKAVTQPLKFNGGDTAIAVDALPICFDCSLDIEGKRNCFRFGESKACRFA